MTKTIFHQKLSNYLISRIVSIFLNTSFGRYDDAKFCLVEKDFCKFMQHAFIIWKFTGSTLLAPVQLVAKILE